MAEIPQESDLLLPHEIRFIPGEYREYYKAKRNNFFSSVQRFSDLWEYHLLLDNIWFREIGDLQVATDVNRVFPTMLFINAHAKIRVSIELGFTGCLQEARSILRDAVETTAYAHHMLKDIAIQKIWFEKNDVMGSKAFKNSFESYKKEVLFQGLEELHEKYGELSETGSHPTPLAFVNRIAFINTGKQLQMQINYTGRNDERSWCLELLTMLLTCFTIENTFFNDYADRLELDSTLMGMRNNFQTYKETLRQRIIGRFGMQEPYTKP